VANFAFNISKGRAVEFYNRVESNDPANSALILVPASASDTEANAQDADDLTAALATAINEQTGGSWVRKTLSDTQLAAFPAPDDTNNRYDVSLPSVTWTAPTGGSDTTGLLVCYDSDTTGGADTAILPISHHDFAVTADGNDVILNSGVFYRAS
jgi:hypothetical protein